MKKGILYIVFGKSYEKFAAHTIRYTRQFTDLPIYILTNIKNRCKLWDEISNMSFKELDFSQSCNRMVKTKMIDYSPFDQTLYLDCDSVIRKEGIENVFELLYENDIVLNLFMYWKKEDKIINLYKKTMIKTKTFLPLNVYNGAFICFKKNDNIKEFFLKWNFFWLEMGRGREMPALACAVKQSNIEVKEINPFIHRFFEPDTYNKEVIVQHNYNSNKGMNFFDEFSLPKLQRYTPFDKDGTQIDWTWVECTNDEIMYS